MCGVDTESVDVFLQSLRWEKHIPGSVYDRPSAQHVRLPQGLRWCFTCWKGSIPCLSQQLYFSFVCALVCKKTCMFAGILCIWCCLHFVTRRKSTYPPWYHKAGYFVCPLIYMPPVAVFGQGCSSSQRKWLSIQSPYSPPVPSVFWRENLPKKTMLTNTKKTEVIAAWDWKNSSTDIQMYGVTHLMLTCLSLSATFRPRQRCLANLAN